MKLTLNKETAAILLSIKECTGLGINQILCNAIKEYALDNKPEVHNDHEEASKEQT